MEAGAQLDHGFVGGRGDTGADRTAGETASLSPNVPAHFVTKCTLRCMLAECHRRKTYFFQKVADLARRRGCQPEQAGVLWEHKGLTNVPRIGPTISSTSRDSSPGKRLRAPECWRLGSGWWFASAPEAAKRTSDQDKASPTPARETGSLLREARGPCGLRARRNDGGRSGRSGAPDRPSMA